MDLKRVEFGAVVTLAIASIAAAVAFGRMSRTLENIDTEQMELAEKQAIKNINSAVTEYLALLPNVRSYLGRKWCDVTKERKPDIEYTNYEKVPIELAVSTRQTEDTDRNQTNRCDLTVTVDKQVRLRTQNYNDKGSKFCAMTITVPAGSEYSIREMGHETPVEVLDWHELRANCP